MATLLLKNVPETLRARLQKSAKAHQRSMNQEAILSLADALDAAAPLPKPVRINQPFDNAFIDRAKRMGRA